MDIITHVLMAERDRAREIIEAIIDAEQNYFFTNDVDYKENRSQIPTLSTAADDREPEFLQQ